MYLRVWNQKTFLLLAHGGIGSVPPGCLGILTFSCYKYCFVQTKGMLLLGSCEHFFLYSCWLYYLCSGVNVAAKQTGAREVGWWMGWSPPHDPFWCTSQRIHTWCNQCFCSWYWNNKKVFVLFDNESHGVCIVKGNMVDVSCKALRKWKYTKSLLRNSEMHQHWFPWNLECFWGFPTSLVIAFLECWQKKLIFPGRKRWKNSNEHDWAIVLICMGLAQFLQYVPFEKSKEAG